MPCPNNENEANFKGTKYMGKEHGVNVTALLHEMALTVCECTAARECMLSKEGHAAAHEQLPASRTHWPLINSVTKSTHFDSVSCFVSLEKRMNLWTKIVKKAQCGKSSSRKGQNSFL